GVDRAIAGGVHGGDEVWIRTMGGIVGKIGQVVDGEAVFTVGRSALVFLHAAPAGTYDVTARAQGQFPVTLDEKNEARVIRSFHVGALYTPRSAAPDLAPPVLATNVIHGR